MTRNPTQQPAVVEMPPWGVSVFESHHAANFRMDVSRHQALEVFYVLGGEGVFELEGRPVRCAPGDVVIIAVGQGHRIKDDPSQPLSLLGVRIRPDVWRSDPTLERQLPLGRLPANDLVSVQVRAEVRRLLFEQTTRRPGYPGMMVGVTLQLLALLVRSAGSVARQQPLEASTVSGHREAVAAYVAELDRRFFEPTKIDSIARQLGMSRRRFTELFREVTNTTWSDYVRTLRINHSKQLLRETARSVLAIAFESGFEDLSSFYRAFQRQEGMAPQRWRQQQSDD
jgi:AraC family L-rhamnose operon regulatory protein RhaS